MLNLFPEVFNFLEFVWLDKVDEFDLLERFPAVKILGDSL
jgi:hypothetical protein